MQKLKNVYHQLQSKFASWKYKYPQKSLTIIGVTGTDGKTTVTSMVYHILKMSGFQVGYISTVKAQIGEKELDTGLHVTTPNPQDVPKYLRMMADEGIKFVVLESTSQGLDQNRLEGIEFDSGIITNIKEDHLDYHKSWENYAKAKFKLIQMVRDQGLVVLNKDDTKSAKWLMEESQSLKQEVYVKWTSLSDAKDIKSDINGIRFTYLDKVIKVPIIGEYNFLNSLQAINLCLRYTDIEKIKAALETFEAPEGRMQIVQKEPFSVIVDFAHTPYALEAALESITSINKGGRIITVFGCAGKRDRIRRMMGKVSAELSDITILTAEDPRDEDLKEINDEILSHAASNRAEVLYRFPNTEDYNQINLEMLKRSIQESLSQKRKPFITFDENSISSRNDAIGLALKIAKPGDIVFITGKGHEKSLSFGENEREYKWSDQKAVRAFLEN